MRPRPEPGVEYGAFPAGEYRAARQLEAEVSLGKFLGIETRAAADLLQDPPALAAELRSRAADPWRALARLRRRYPDPSLFPPP